MSINLATLLVAQLRGASGTAALSARSATFDSPFIPLILHPVLNLAGGDIAD